MRFYTNVQMVGDNFLVRGYEDGKHFMPLVRSFIQLFLLIQKEKQNIKH